MSSANLSPAAKRKAAELGDTVVSSGASSSSSAPASAVDAADAAADKRTKSSAQESKDDAKLEDASFFDPMHLKVYYKHLFPYDDMYKWLCYGHDAKLHPGKGTQALIDPNFFLKREFSFTLQGDSYIRYLSFANAAEMKKAMVTRGPMKVDLGAYYNAPAKDRDSVRNFVPVLRELVFDIDLTDYDPIRTSASGAAITTRCWCFMMVAIKVLDERLRADFGFQHMFWVYSGRRGVHCWVCDRRALALEDSARAAIAEYLSVIKGSDLVADIRSPLHPLLHQTFPLLQDVFLNDIIEGEGQALLSNEDNWHRILQFVPDADGFHADMRTVWRRMDSAKARWRALLEEAVALQGRTKRLEVRRALENLAEKIIFTCVYPRLDVNVSTHRNHLLKSPFVVHPSTGRVCIPIDPKHADAFNPLEAPTLAMLVMELTEYDSKRTKEERDAVPAMDKTCMRHHMQLWRKSFLDPLYEQLGRDFEARLQQRQAGSAGVKGGRISVV